MQIPESGPATRLCQQKRLTVEQQTAEVWQESAGDRVLAWAEARAKKQRAELRLSLPPQSNSYCSGDATLWIVRGMQIYWWKRGRKYASTTSLVNRTPPPDKHQTSIKNLGGEWPTGDRLGVNSQRHIARGGDGTPVPAGRPWVVANKRTVRTKQLRGDVHTGCIHSAHGQPCLWSGRNFPKKKQHISIRWSKSPRQGVVSDLCLGGVNVQSLKI